MEFDRPLCECDSMECLEAVPITLDEWSDFQKEGFIVVPGHQEPTDEIVREGDGYLIVRGDMS